MLLSQILVMSHTVTSIFAGRALASAEASLYHVVTGQILLILHKGMILKTELGLLPALYRLSVPHNTKFETN
jgi:hypothetical protein